MNSPNFYSGDLAAINAGQVAENDSNTRSEDSLRRYLAEQARTRAHLQQTNNYREVGMRDADVRREIGLGEIGGRKYATDKTAETAALQAAIEKELGLGQNSSNERVAGINAKAVLDAENARLSAAKVNADEARQYARTQALLAPNPNAEAAFEQGITDADKDAENATLAAFYNSRIPEAIDNTNIVTGFPDLFRDSRGLAMEALNEPGKHPDRRSRLLQTMQKMIAPDHATRVILDQLSGRFIQAPAPKRAATPQNALSYHSSHLARALETIRNDKFQNKEGRMQAARDLYKTITGLDAAQ